VAKIIGLEGLTGEEIERELQRGARFVVYQYAVSILVMSFMRGSNIYFLRGGESGRGARWTCTLASLLFGWWGIPWGPIFTIQAVAANLGGGKDVTNDVLAQLGQA